MLFTQPIFFAFFALIFTLSWLARGHRQHKMVLLAASYLFYAAWDIRFLSLILLSTAVDYLAGNALGKTLQPTRRRLWLLTSLVVNLGILGFFKYANFFIGEMVTLLRFLGIERADPALDIILPVGISFYTFQTLSYTIDVYRGRLEPVESRLDFALFVAFFPQLVAGPIVRAAHFLPQLRARPRFASVDVRACLTLFLFGFIKKVCIADQVAPYVDRVFAEPGVFNTLGLWIAVLLYAIQIYGDFSGYSDMAIAGAGLLGYDLGKNFAFPYFAANLADFWRRWHISLSTWLRDYLYIPLGGNRGKAWHTGRNLMLTMVLGGLWHGAAWTFILWGVWHGLALSLHRAWRTRFPASSSRPWHAWLGTAATFYVVCLGWVFFRAHSLQDASLILKSLVLFQDLGPLSLDPLWLVGITFLAAIHWLQKEHRLFERIGEMPAASWAMTYGVAWALALAFVPLRSQPFIYFQF